MASSQLMLTSRQAGRGGEIYAHVGQGGIWESWKNQTEHFERVTG